MTDLGGEAVVEVDVVQKVVSQKRVHLANAVVQLRCLSGRDGKGREVRFGQEVCLPLECKAESLSVVSEGAKTFTLHRV